MTTRKKKVWVAHYKSERFYVRSEQTAYNPRVYWVEDVNGQILTGETKSRKRAEKQCTKLNSEP